MNIMLLIWINALAVSTMCASHRDHDILKTIPVVASLSSISDDSSGRKSVRPYNVKIEHRKRHHAPIIHKVLSLCCELELKIHARAASRISIRDDFGNAWEVAKLDEISQDFYVVEQKILKNPANIHDEYHVEIDGQKRKCLFRPGIKWHIFIDNGRFVYDKDKNNE